MIKNYNLLGVFDHFMLLKYKDSEIMPVGDTFTYRIGFFEEDLINFERDPDDMSPLFTVDDIDITLSEIKIRLDDKSLTRKMRNALSSDEEELSIQKLMLIPLEGMFNEETPAVESLYL